MDKLKKIEIAAIAAALAVGGSTVYSGLKIENLEHKLKTRSQVWEANITDDGMTDYLIRGSTESSGKMDTAFISEGDKYVKAKLVFWDGNLYFVVKGGRYDLQGNFLNTSQIPAGFTSDICADAQAGPAQSKHPAEFNPYDCGRP